MASTKSLAEIADSIVLMPRDEGLNDSHVSLLEATGYMDRRGEISVDDLYQRLVRDPRLLEAWQVWSDDNRGWPAWFFSVRGLGPFEVGYVGRRGERLEHLTFDDGARACAEYIRREIDSIAEVADMWRHHPWRLIPETIAWLREGWRDRKKF